MTPLTQGSSAPADWAAMQSSAAHGWHRVALAAQELQSIASSTEFPTCLARAGRDLTGLSSAVVVAIGPRAHVVHEATGPAGEALADRESVIRSLVSRARLDSTRSVVLAADDADELDPLVRQAAALRDLGVSRLVATPVAVGEDLFGLLVLADDEPGELADDLVEQLEVLGALAAGAWQIRASMDRLIDLAHLDPLTGLLHRRAFRDRLDGWHPVTSPTTCALVFDIDRFKRVNDTFGHEAGDQLLIAVARAISGILRSDDTLYRIGGDEFVALIENVTPEIAGRIADRARVAAAETGGSISIGVASTTEERDLAAAYAAADGALLEAKKAGRDTVVLV